MIEQIRTCGAMGRNGFPCKRHVGPGFTRCNLHGGATPLARQAASEALARAALPAAEALFDIIDRYHREVCDTCGMPNGDPNPVIRAAQLILDRTGFHPSVTVQVDGSVSVPSYLRWVPQERLTLMKQWLEEARLAHEAGDAAPDDAALNGTVIEVEPVGLGAPERAAQTPVTD